MIDRTGRAAEKWAKVAHRTLPVAVVVLDPILHLNKVLGVSVVIHMNQSHEESHQGGTAQNGGSERSKHRAHLVVAVHAVQSWRHVDAALTL